MTLQRLAPTFGTVGVFLIAANVWAWTIGGNDGAGPFWAGLALIGAWRLVSATPTAEQLEHDPYLLSPGVILAAGVITVTVAALAAMVLYGVVQVLTASNSPLDQGPTAPAGDDQACWSSPSCEVGEVYRP